MIRVIACDNAIKGWELEEDVVDVSVAGIEVGEFDLSHHVELNSVELVFDASDLAASVEEEEAADIARAIFDRFPDVKAELMPEPAEVAPVEPPRWSPTINNPETKVQIEGSSYRAADAGRVLRSYLGQIAPGDIPLEGILLFVKALGQIDPSWCEALAFEALVVSEREEKLKSLSLAARFVAEREVRKALRKGGAR